MPSKANINQEKIQKQKRTIGITAVIILLIITAVSIALQISFIIWILADLIVASIANLLLRRVGSRPL